MKFSPIRALPCARGIQVLVGLLRCIAVRAVGPVWVSVYGLRLTEHAAAERAAVERAAVERVAVEVAAVEVTAVEFAAVEVAAAERAAVERAAAERAAVERAAVERAAVEVAAVDLGWTKYHSTWPYIDIFVDVSLVRRILVLVNWHIAAAVPMSAKLDSTVDQAIITEVCFSEAESTEFRNFARQRALPERLAFEQCLDALLDI